ncbi:hypothetical protein BJ875DRAFT_370352 [Amylocarpus encephaloides]|uniref:Methyltransferase domain-containing protein n=1 Tax=Amylocarpus encephaloides TaxID=45428 RepID=A0A9P7YQ01_9HELO|nr:hypothetical protein BJ875DRAFT_370352 [Amylocarpus encephaloides]
MVYSENGELVDPNKPKIVTPSDLTVTSLLRLIKKDYYHEFRDRMDDIILHEMDGSVSLVVNNGGEQHHFPRWQFQPSTSAISEHHSIPDPITQDESRGSPRILELGCGSGAWCFHAKSVHPDWVVHGIDDTDHWLCVHKDTKLRDFLDASGTRKGTDDCFGGADPPSDTNPQFSVRNLNNLLSHDLPLQRNSYRLIHGRQVFEKIESYKNFLDVVGLLLHPRGVVEFLEVDPIPRTIGPMRQCAENQKTEAFAPWTNTIEDRLGDTRGSDLQDTVPGWFTRVEEVLNASLRPQDGVPAANLKTWLQASGFYDVKQAIFQLPIGGDTASGKKLQDLLLYQFKLEDSIPKLKSVLPEVEIDEIKSGVYYLNFHIVTGRKPPYPRTGDLLPDGTRYGMTPSTYNAMARQKLNDDTVKNYQWERSVQALLNSI